MKNQKTFDSEPPLDIKGEELLSLLFNNLEDLFLLVDTHLNIKLTNHKTKKAIKDELGLSFKEGMSVLLLAPPDRHEFLKSLYQDVFSGNSRSTELMLESPSGQKTYLENIFKPARNNQGKIIGAIVIVRDITEKKNAEAGLREMEERWRFALEGANQGVWDWNMVTNEIFYSSSYKKLYGFQEDELKNTLKEWESRIHPNDKYKIKEAIEKHIKSKDPYYESFYRIKDKKEQYKWIMARGVIIGKDGSGNPLRMIGTHTDITDRVKAEENYRLLFYNNPLPMWTYHLDTLRFLDVNNAAVFHYGYSKEEFLAMTIKDIRPKEDIKLLENLIEERRNAISKHTVARHLKKNGEVIWVDLSTNKLEKEDSNYILVLANDITERTRVQNELVKSNERFLYAAKASSEALWEWNITTGELYISETYTDLLGWKIKDIKNFDDWHSNMHQEDKKPIIESFHKSLAEPQTALWSREYRYLRADGQIAYLLNKAVIIRNEKKKAVKVVGAIQDVTGQKKAEQELKKSNERFLLASRASSDAIYDWNLITDEVNWGEGMFLLFGYDQNDKTINLWKKSIHKDDKARIEKSLFKAMSVSKKKIWKEEYRFIKGDGTFSHVLDRGFIMRDASGKPIRMVGSMQDISERKYNEQLLSLERSIFELSANPSVDLKFIVDQLLKGIESLHPDAFTSVLVLNDDGTAALLAAPRLPLSYKKAVNGRKLGPRDGACGAAMHSKKTIIVENVDVDSKCKGFREFAGKFGIKACWSLPIIHSTKIVMGSFGIYFKEVKSPTLSETNTLERIRNILRILMEHHWSLKEIKSANERFDIMMKATHDLIWDWNLENNIIYRGDEGLKTVYGIKNNETIQTNEQWFKRIHPDDRLKVSKVISQVIESKDKKTFDVEYRFQKDDKTYSSVFDRGIIIRNPEGKPIRMIGAAQDITQRKRMEQDLLQNQLEIQKAINQATIDTQEQERGEIGKELHDNVNQVLTTTKLYLDLALSNPELKDELIHKSTKNIIDVINEIRQLSKSLMDPSIGDLGLIDSIKDLIENINLTRKLQVGLTVNEKIESALNKNQKLTIFRIIQETLNNAMKHAKATTVQINLGQTENALELIIQDDGIGFHPEQVKKGVGLKNIKNRIYLINGTHTITSEPEKGCIINIKFPLHQ
ncbi:MAG: hypothetical protein NVSMB67_09110 [Flavisolibacter sp.]